MADGGGKVRAPLKASGWWNYKIPPMLAVAYYAIAASPAIPPLRVAGPWFVPYLIAAASIAAFGHVYLDAFDLAEDRLLKKENLWAPLSNPSRAVLIALLLAGAILPWLFLPTGPVLFTLLGAELLMFVLYATPPVRLKERGFPGVVADSLYAHALPALWTWIPFAALAGTRSGPGFIGTLGGWAAMVGMRHLIQHQVSGSESDAAAGAATYVVRKGTRASLALLVKGLLPLETVFFVALALQMGPRAPWVLGALTLYATWQAVKFRFLWDGEFALFGNLTDADRATLLGTLVLSRFYERWLPLLMLAWLTASHASYGILLVLHMLFFRQGLREVRQDARLLRSWLRRRRAFAVRQTSTV
jgi:hypothetical protein